MRRAKLILIPALSLGFFAVLTCISGTGAAQNAPKSAAIPEHVLLRAAETHLPLRIKPGKPQIIHLDQPVAAAVIDDIPDRITAIPQGNSLVLFPHSAGGAHLTVRGNNGETIMARYLVVADPSEKYIRIRQTCKDKQGEGCDVSHIYYCPNLCYQTHLVNISPDTPATAKAK